MPFRNSPDNMNALRMLGQTLVNGRQQEAQTRLQIAIAQQAAARQARQDALQAGVWEAQAGRAKTQSALDATRQKEIDDRIAAINQLSSIMGDTNNTPESAAVRAALMRVAGHGRQHIIENAAQLNSLGNPDLAARMATGSHLPSYVPAGATAVDWQGNPTFRAEFAPGRSDAGSFAAMFGAAGQSAKDAMGASGQIPDPKTDQAAYDRYEANVAIQKAAGEAFLALLNAQTNGGPAMSRAPVFYGQQPRVGAGTVLTPPGAPPPVAPSQSSVTPPPDSNAFLYEILRRAQVMPSQDQADANAAEVMRRLGPAQATPAPAPVTDPGTEDYYDEKTGRIIRSFRPPER